MCLNVPLRGVGVSWKRECGGLRDLGVDQGKREDGDGNDTQKSY